MPTWRPENPSVKLEKDVSLSSLVENEDSPFSPEITKEEFIRHIEDDMGLHDVSIEKVIRLKDSVYALVGLSISGAVHYSKNKIDSFREGFSSPTGKYGSEATYFGAGDLSGETFSSLENDPTMFLHRAKIEGTFLLISDGNILGLRDALLGIREPGRRPSRVRSYIQNADLIGLTRGTVIDNEKVTGVIIADESFKTAEIVVAADSISQVKVI